MSATYQSQIATAEAQAVLQTDSLVTSRIVVTDFVGVVVAERGGKDVFRLLTGY